MRTRPWPIVLVAIYYVLAPLGYALLTCWLMKMGLSDFFRHLFNHEGALEITRFLLLCPLAGVAVYRMSKWGYAFVLLFEALTLYMNYRNYVMHPSVMSLPMLVGFSIVDLALISYFLLPAVRKVFLDSSLHWWEAKPRYRVHFKAVIFWQNEKKRATVTDFSEGGVFIQTGQKLEKGQILDIEFEVLDRTVRTQAKIVHHRVLAPQGYGTQFVNLDPKLQQSIQNIAHVLDRIGFEIRNPRPPLKQDFAKWAKQLATTGEGLLPRLEKFSPPTPHDASLSRDAHQTVI